MTAPAQHDTAEETLQRLFTDRSVIGDPFPLYNTIREAAPVFRARFLPIWVVSGYPEVQAVFRRPEFGKRDELTRGWGNNLDDDETYAWMSRYSLLRQNPPDHTRLRGLVSRGFTPRRVTQLRANIDTITAELLDTVSDRAEFDLMDALAFPLPVRVLGELLGIPEQDRPQFRELTESSVRLIDPGSTPEILAQSKSDCQTMERYFQDLIARKRRHPGDDLTTALIEVRDGQDMITEDELLATLMVLFVGGVETTTNLIGTAILTFIRHPDQLTALREDRSLMSSTVEECLRYLTPSQSTLRTVLADTSLEGHQMRDGDMVLTILAAANRDPRVYDNPNRFDIRRSDNHHVAFIAGIHHCLGAALARLEADAVFTAILDRYRHLELAAEPAWRQNITVHALDSLHLTATR